MSNYDRRDRQDETAMWDAGEVRRQESAQQQRRGDEKRRSARRRTGTAIYLVCVVLGSCLLAGIGWLMINDLCSLNKAPVEVEITVDEGDSVSDVAKKLKDAGLVNSKGFFQLASGFLHYSRYVEPGTYKLNSDMDFRALIVNMHDWEQDSMDAQGLVQVTIPEGYTVRQIIDLLAEKGVATKAELEDACANFDFENYSFLSSDTLGSIDRMEGFLFPTTYTFDKNKTAVFAVDTMLTMFKNEISQQMLEDIKNSPYDLKQIITMPPSSRRSPLAMIPSARTSAPSSTTVWSSPIVRRAAACCSCAPPSTISWSTMASASSIPPSRVPTTPISTRA